MSSLTCAENIESLLMSNVVRIDKAEDDYKNSFMNAVRHLHDKDNIHRDILLMYEFLSKKLIDSTDKEKALELLLEFSYLLHKVSLKEEVNE